MINNQKLHLPLQEEIIGTCPPIVVYTMMRVSTCLFVVAAAGGRPGYTSTFSEMGQQSLFSNNTRTARVYDERVEVQQTAERLS